MLEILIGNIASGKSTYCRNKAKDGFLILNDDAVVNMLHCDMYHLYAKELKPIYKAIENQVVLSSLSLNQSLIVDRGLNLTPRSRRRFIGLAHSLDVQVTAIIFEFCNPEVHAKRRMDSDSRGHTWEYWLSVANLFNDKYMPPTTDEGFDKIIYL